MASRWPLQGRSVVYERLVGCLGDKDLPVAGPRILVAVRGDSWSSPIGLPQRLIDQLGELLTCAAASEWATRLLVAHPRLPPGILDRLIAQRLSPLPYRVDWSLTTEQFLDAGSLNQENLVSLLRDLFLRQSAEESIPVCIYQGALYSHGSRRSQDHAEMDRRGESTFRQRLREAQKRAGCQAGRGLRMAY
ncbi:hypothetical protein B0T14DRAFT_238109 [Immersiella caudata]|uniref:Uncharacterized protein n=1 Tax=Immersiella caudata TaxID=314043 RepID=A0AA39WSM1_9PEZI|nr:hypothetical protein B0T14DRAFT_238109 [Immersiella caudata]